MFRQAVPVVDLPEQRGSGYPEPFRSRMGDRVKRRLGEAFGLTQYGVNLVQLGPDGQSALRHFHTHEEEFVYVLEGELVLVSNVGEQVVRTGLCIGFPANTGNAHHFVHRSKAPATYLEIGSRRDADMAFYPDDDLCWVRDADGTQIGAHKDGKKY